MHRQRRLSRSNSTRLKNRDAPIAIGDLRYFGQLETSCIRRSHCTSQIRGPMKTPIRIVLFTLTVSLFSASNPFVGVWKLNSTQSKFTDVRGPFFATIQIESAGTDLKLTASTVDGEGIASDFTSTCACLVAERAESRMSSAYRKALPGSIRMARLQC